MARPARSGSQGASGTTEAPFDAPRRSQAGRHLPVRLPTTTGHAASPVTPVPREPQGLNWRVRIFRLLRLIVAATLFLVGGRFMSDRWQYPVADEAYIQDEIVPVRSPIEGELRLHAGRAGATVDSGQLLFEVNNSRYGNREAPLQLHWARESVGRLEHETAEAGAQLQFHEKICQAHRELYREKLIPMLELLEHERKLETARKTC